MSARNKFNHRLDAKDLGPEWDFPLTATLVVAGVEYACWRRQGPDNGYFATYQDATGRHLINVWLR